MCGASDDNQKHEGELISGQSLIEIDFGSGAGAAQVIVKPVSTESVPIKQPAMTTSTAPANVPYKVGHYCTLWCLVAQKM
jgi:hypothetical protein